MRAEDFLDQEPPSADDFLGDGQTRPVRRGGTLAEARSAGQTGRGAGGFNEADPRRLDAQPQEQRSLLDSPGQSDAADPMLQPEFVSRFRGMLADTPAHARMPALQQYAKGNDVWARAARQILREAQGENAKITPDDESLARKIGPAGGGSGWSGTRQPKVAIPDPTPSFGDTMDGIGPEDVAQRRETAGRIADAGRVTLQEAKAAARQQRSAQPNWTDDTALEVPRDLALSGAAGLANLIASGAGLADAMSADGSLRQGMARSVAEWASGVGEDLGSMKGPGLKAEEAEFGRLVMDGNASVADMAGYLVTHPALFASKAVESVIPMLVSGAAGRVAGGAAGRASTGAIGGTAATPAVAARVSEIAGSGAAAGAVVAEAAQIAGGVFNKLVDEGYGREAAQRSAGNAFLGALAIGKVFQGGAAGAVAQGRQGVMREAGQEFGEEYAQTWLEGVAPAIGAGKELDLAQTNREAVAGGLIGAGVGGSVGAVNSVAAFLAKPAMADGKPVAPTEAKSTALKRFDELAAAHGINSAAVQRAKQAAADMPADQVPAFLERLTDALTKRGLVAKPIDEQSLQALAAAVDPADDTKDQAVSSIEDTLRKAGALPSAGTGAPPSSAPEQAGATDGQAQEASQEVLNPGAPSGAPSEALGVRLEDIEGDPINRKWSSFAPDSGTLNIPREQMPQIDAEHRGALVNFLAARGVAAEQEAVAPESLKPTQREFEPGKVRAMAGGAGGKRRILVSSDDHILDGHHQWLAKRESGESVEIIRLDAPIQDLLRLAHQFPSSTTAKGPRSEKQSASQDQTRNGGAPALQALAERQGQVPEPTESVLPQLRGPGDQDVRSVGSELPGVSDGDRPEANGSAQPGSDQQRRQLRTGQRPLGDETRSGEQPTKEPRPDAQRQVSNPGAVGQGNRDGSVSSALPDPSGSNDPRAGADNAKPERPEAGPGVAARILGSYGRTPGAATEIELRPNDDGTLTPWTGKYPMVDYESGDPIRVPAESTDAEVVDAIRAANAVTNKDKFFGVKGDAKAAAQPETAAQADDAQAEPAGEPRRDELSRRMKGLRALVACLSK